MKEQEIGAQDRVDDPFFKSERWAFGEAAAQELQWSSTSQLVSDSIHCVLGPHFEFSMGKTLNSTLPPTSVRVCVRWTKKDYNGSNEVLEVLYQRAFKWGL